MQRMVFNFLRAPLNLGVILFILFKSGHLSQVWFCLILFDSHFSIRLISNTLLSNFLRRVESDLIETKIKGNPTRLATRPSFPGFVPPGRGAWKLQRINLKTLYILVSCPTFQLDIFFNWSDLGSPPYAIFQHPKNREM